MKSGIHPKYKTKYRIGNWASYDRALVQRGDVTLWFAPEAIIAWHPEPTGRRGAQLQFSDLAIETALTLRLVYRLPLRQTEGARDTGGVYAAVGGSFAAIFTRAS